MTQIAQMDWKTRARRLRLMPLDALLLLDSDDLRHLRHLWISAALARRPDESSAAHREPRRAFPKMTQMTQIVLTAEISILAFLNLFFLDLRHLRHLWMAGPGLRRAA